MKKLASGFLAITLVSLTFISCERKGEAPELPPYESMAIDFSKFKVNDTKSAVGDLKNTETGTKLNFTYAALNVAYFNTILTVTLAVPVLAFQNSFNQVPVFLGDATWQWSCDYEYFGGAYHARLTGEVRSDDVKWEMYISRTGIGAFGEFLWYEGTSQSDGSGGQWILNHSQVYQEPSLQIDWERTGDSIGWIKYEIIRELNDQRADNVYMGSFIEADHSDAAMDASYNIHVYDIWTLQDFADVNIEWSTTEYYGHVKSPLFYNNADWHCWDGYGYDITCE